MIWLTASQAAASGLLFSTLFKAGLEVDTNPQRLVGVTSDSDLVERFFLQADLDHQQPGQMQHGSIRLGGKRFYRTGDEDTLIADLSGTIWYRLFEGVAISSRLTVRDRTERGHIRDYARLGANLGLTFSFAGFHVRAGPAAGYFLYKPNPDLCSRSVGGFAETGYHPSASWSVGVSYSFTDRLYRQRQVFSSATGLRYDQDNARQDADHVVGASVAYNGPFMVNLDLYWQRNLSNSYGKRFSRFIGRLTGAFPLPWEFIANLQGSLQQTGFDEGVLVDPTFTVEDENRNSLVVAISRPITSWLRAEIRYSWYTQEFGGDESTYQRHLIYGGLIADSGEWSGQGDAAWSGE
ncbi:MAG: hypothetical protein JW797_01190 [Bradymonadales bacterium]|nr:hypothetical protein [Bradymonadales bacterium]